MVTSRRFALPSGGAAAAGRVASRAVLVALLASTSGACRYAGPARPVAGTATPAPEAAATGTSAPGATGTRARPAARPTPAPGDVATPPGGRRFLPALPAGGAPGAAAATSAAPGIDPMPDVAARPDAADAGTAGEPEAPGGPGEPLDPASPAGRSALLAEAVGYGRRARGGADGPTVRVTSLADEGPGSLRALAEDASGPRWIVFDVDGVIRLERPIRVAPDTTIDGRGRRVELTGHGLDADGVRGVVVANLLLRHGEADAVVVRRGARDVWLHRLSLQSWTDGLVDVQRGATDVTVSWSHFLDHEKVMLLGSDAAHGADDGLRVTLHHNLFERTGQRHPRLRRGRAHAFNNVLWHWQSYGMAADHDGQLLVEANVFDPGPDAEEAVKVEAADGVPGRIRAVGNVVLGDVPLAEHSPETVFDPRDDYPYAAEPAGDALVARVRAGAGWRP